MTNRTFPLSIRGSCVSCPIEYRHCQSAGDDQLVLFLCTVGPNRIKEQIKQVIPGYTTYLDQAAIGRI
jgi:hypothetical protein